MLCSRTGEGAPVRKAARAIDRVRPLSGLRKVEAATHPDLHSVRTPPERHEMPVDAMREFCSHLAHKPSRGGRVVGIVEDADDFNAESANSFLKTLEEPPTGAILLLIATGTDRQLPTILSRCQIVRFAPLGPTDLATILEEQGIADRHGANVWLAWPEGAFRERWR